MNIITVLSYIGWPVLNNNDVGANNWSETEVEWAGINLASMNAVFVFMNLDIYPVIITLTGGKQFIGEFKSINWISFAAMKWSKLNWN